MPFPLPKDCDKIAKFEMIGENRPAHFSLSALHDDEDGMRNYLATLVHVSLSATSQVWGIDRDEFLSYFEDLAAHREGWDGEKRVANLYGELCIGCLYDDTTPSPRVWFEVRLATADTDPLWAVQLQVEMRAEALADLAWRARLFFGKVA